MGNATIEDFKRLGLIEYPSGSGQYVKISSIKSNPAKPVVKPEKAPKKPKEDSLANIKFVLTQQNKPFKAEYIFHPTRKWRFDLAFPEIKLAIEYEGVKVRKTEKSRHTTITGYTEDTRKYNEAVKLGWRVLRYTSITIGNILEDIEFFHLHPFPIPALDNIQSI